MYLNGYIYFVYFVITCIFLETDAGCNKGSTPESNKDNLDTNTGTQYILTSSTYTISCCGVLSTIQFYPKETGFIQFQVWRPLVTNVYNLVGEYRYYVPSKNEKRTVIVSDEITVQTNDVIGWYCEGTDIVPYNVGTIGDNIVLPNHVDYSINTNHSVTTPYVNQRSYAIVYFITDGSAPYFTSLPATVDVYDHVVSGEFLHKVEYTDPETGDIPYLTLTINSLSPSTSNIALDVASGNVTTTGSISKGTIKLDAKITDPCGLTVTKRLTINVLNYAPEIHNLPSSVNLDESTNIETWLFNISVSDKSGDRVTCSLKSSSPNNAPFLVKTISRTSTYAIYSKARPQFRYDTTPSYDLTIECTDDKDPVTKVFSVYLIRNDPPTITNLPKSLTLSTDTATGTTIYIVLGTDPENDALRFSLHSSNTPFVVADTGQVIVDDAMDQITNQHWDISIRVYDGISYSDYFILSILFSGVNNKPTINNLPWSLSIPETTAVGTVIYTLSITEFDADDVLHYQFSYNPTNAGVKFSFDKTTLEVKILEELDYESGETQYVISFTVDDTHLSDGPLDLTITVLESNEYPMFSKQKYYITDYEDSINRPLPAAGFTVTDPDVNDSTTYSIVPSTYSHYFTMAPSDGSLTYAVTYDIDLGYLPTFVCLTVQVEDSRGLTATSLLIITVLDSDDNVPVFTQNTYEFTVSSDAAILTQVGQVTATDKDSSQQYREMVYSIVENTDSIYFGIKVVSGYIYVYRTLSSFPNYRTFSFQVRAQCVVHLTSTSHRDTADVKITITPVTITDYFDNAANIAWVTVVTILGTVVLAVIAMLVYRKRESIKNLFNCCERSSQNPSKQNSSKQNSSNVKRENLLSTKKDESFMGNPKALPVIEEKCGLPWDEDYIGYERRQPKAPTPVPSVVKVKPKESDVMSVASSTHTNSKLLWSNYNNWANRVKTA